MGSFHPGGARALPVPLQRFLLKVCPHRTSCFHCCEIPAAAKISTPISGWFSPTSLFLSASHEHFHSALSAPDIPVGVPCVWVPPFCSLQMPFVINGKVMTRLLPADLPCMSPAMEWPSTAFQAKCSAGVSTAGLLLSFYLFIYLKKFFFSSHSGELIPKTESPFPMHQMLSTNEIPPARHLPW